jgi:hypothetical protein
MMSLDREILIIEPAANWLGATDFTGGNIVLIWFNSPFLG